MASKKEHEAVRSLARKRSRARAKIMREIHPDSPLAAPFKESFEEKLARHVATANLRRSAALQASIERQNRNRPQPAADEAE